jgi:hypothetical protein
MASRRKPLAVQSKMIPSAAKTPIFAFMPHQWRNFLVQARAARHFEQEAARRMLIRLVRAGEGTEDALRRALSDLEANSGVYRFEVH